MGSTLFLAAGALCVVTALIHSWRGEARIIAPLLREAAGVMSRPLPRKVMRFAWHWVSVLWTIVALVLFSAGFGRPIDAWLLVVIGASHLALGAFDAVYTRGKHVGWPPITLAGVLTLLGVYVTR